ncbi:Ribonuclease H-like domain [Cinara cedri]|uniref:Ribonuclease H-like domain n=1 Tax=Cinara cedri TaxID=506608 RepID=A0A5E4NAT4_9HEMI|nr:Ribonuclease H-like domain [Cinara cedri]
MSDKQENTTPTLLIQVQKSNNNLQHSGNRKPHHFSQFANERGIAVIATSPRCPRSNSLAEKGVGIAKSLLKRVEESKAGIQLMLSEYRNSVIIGCR